MIVIFNLGVEDRNFYYFSGIEEPCKGIVLWDGKHAKVLVSELEAGIAEKYAGDVVVFKNSDELWNLIERELRGYKVIGVNAKRLPFRTFRKLKKALKGKRIEDVSKKLEELRRIKKEEEVEKIKKACKIASKTLEKIPELVCEEMSERELAIELEHIAKKLGAEGFSFPTIVASGERTRKIHTNPEERKIRGALIVDMGPVYKMYTADVSRSFFLGKNREYERLYERVLEAEIEVLENLKDGVEICEICKMVERKIGKMKHCLGHGVGLEAHEKPFLNKKSREKLEKGEVIAIEPAVYSPFGIRIEDVVLIEKKAKILTKLRKDLEFAII